MKEPRHHDTRRPATDRRDRHHRDQQAEERAAERARDMQTGLTTAIAQVEERAAERARDMETGLTNAITQGEERAAERARDMQAELLTGLAAFARGNFARFHSIETTQTDTQTRVAALEERVLYLETRRPPQ